MLHNKKMANQTLSTVYGVIAFDFEGNAFVDKKIEKSIAKSMNDYRYIEKEIKKVETLDKEKAENHKKNTSTETPTTFEPTAKAPKHRGRPRKGTK